MPAKYKLTTKGQGEQGRGQWSLVTPSPTRKILMFSVWPKIKLQSESKFIAVKTLNQS